MAQPVVSDSAAITPEVAPLVSPNTSKARQGRDHWLNTLIVITTILMFTLAVSVGVRLLTSIHHTLLLFSLGGLIAYALDPLVETVRKARLPSGKSRSRTGSVFVVFILMILIVFTGLAFIGKFTAKEVRMLIRDNSTYQAGIKPTATPSQKELAKHTYEARAQHEITEEDKWLYAHHIHLNLKRSIQHPPTGVKALSQKITNNALKVIASIGKFFVESVLVLLISLYMLIYSEEIRKRGNAHLPDWLTPYAEQWQDDVNAILGGFVRGQLLVALVMGVLGGMLCLIIGIKLWAIIGLFIVVASLIPVVGPYIGAIPALISAAITPTDGFMTPLIRVVVVIVFFVVINEFGSKILYPRLVGAALGLHEVLVFFVLFAGFEVSGLTGVLFAAPLTALCIATLPQLYRLWVGAPPISLVSPSNRQNTREESN